MRLNEAFAAYQQEKNWKTESAFANALISYCTGMIRTHFPDRLFMEEAIGDVIKKVWENLSQYECSKSAFETWVGTIIHNVCCDLQQARFLDSPLSKNIPIPETQHSRENQLTLKACIVGLSPEDRNLVTLKLQGYENKEIAEETEMTLSQVEKKWAKVVETLILLAHEK